jgi:F-type H+-transporting ATPase subunit b
MDATFWATVGLFIFLAIVIYAGVPAMVAKSLDARADKIRNELEEARRLREEAQQLLAEYQRKRKEAEQEAGDIVAAAKREAKACWWPKPRRTPRTTSPVVRPLAEQKIAQAERDAVNEVRSSAVDVAIAAAGRSCSPTGSIPRSTQRSSSRPSTTSRRG